MPPESQPMSATRERDVMACRACGNEERASEGYPCAGCGTFICVICDLKGVTRCRACDAAAVPAPAEPSTTP